MPSGLSIGIAASGSQVPLPFLDVDWTQVESTPAEWDDSGTTPTYDAEGLSSADTSQDSLSTSRTSWSWPATWTNGTIMAKLDVETLIDMFVNVDMWNAEFDRVLSTGITYTAGVLNIYAIDDANFPSPGDIEQALSEAGVVILAASLYNDTLHLRAYLPSGTVETYSTAATSNALTDVDFIQINWQATSQPPAEVHIQRTAWWANGLTPDQTESVAIDWGWAPS